MRHDNDLWLIYSNNGYPTAKLIKGDENWVCAPTLITGFEARQEGFTGVRCATVGHVSSRLI